MQKVRAQSVRSKDLDLDCDQDVDGLWGKWTTCMSMLLLLFFLIGVGVILSLDCEQDVEGSSCRWRWPVRESGWHGGGGGASLARCCWCLLSYSTDSYFHPLVFVFVSIS